MRTLPVKTILFVFLIVCFGITKAQDQLITDENEFATADLSKMPQDTDQKIRISNFYQNADNASAIRIKCPSTVTLKVKFFTMNGDLAKEDMYSLESGNNELVLNENGLNQGAYMVQFYTNKGSALRRYTKSYLQ